MDARNHYREETAKTAGTNVCNTDMNRHRSGGGSGKEQWGPGNDTPTHLRSRDSSWAYPRGYGTVSKSHEIMGDGDTRDRMRIVSDTYAKVVAGEEVAGMSALPEALAEKLDVLVPMPDRVGRILDDLDRELAERVQTGILAVSGVKLRRTGPFSR